MVRTPQVPAPWSPHGRKSFTIGNERANRVIDRAVAAWRVSHPESDGDGLWAVTPGNSLSGKDPRENVHSLDFYRNHCLVQNAQGAPEVCVQTFLRDVEGELTDNGCTVERIK